MTAATLASPQQISQKIMSHDEALGMMEGLAIGDALGAYLEFSDRREASDYVREYKDGGPHRLKRGYWTDDTSMSKAIADALQLVKGEFDAHIVMQNFCDWFTGGAFSSTGACFDIGMTCQAALQKYMKDKSNPYCGGTDEYSSGNGAIMRMAPVVIAAASENECVDHALKQTMLTHGSAECLLFSEAFARELWWGKALPEYNKLRLDRKTPREDVKSSGYVRHTYEAAWWCIDNTSSFEEAVIEAVNLGGDADTIGAVTGQIAGRIYGETGIPDWMYEGLYAADAIRHLAQDLHDLSFPRNGV